MTDWVSQKAAFQEQYNDINTYVSGAIGSTPASLADDKKIVTDALTRYMANQTQADEGLIQTTMENIRMYQTKLTKLNGDITDAINSYAAKNDMDALLSQNGQLNQKIAAAQKRYDEYVELAYTADERNKNLRSRESNITTHKVFLLGRPLRPASIPYLWALSFLFVCMALLIFYYYNPINIPPIYILLAMAQDLLYNPRIWAGLFGIASIIILFLVLKLVGYM
jgi:hypothetical protein